MTAAMRVAVPLPAQQPTALRSDPWSFIPPLASSAVMTVLLLAGARRGWTPVQAALAFSSAAWPCFAYAGWRRTRRTHVPLFALLAAAHAIFYTAAAFWTDALAASGAETLTAVLAFANLGVLGLFVGMRSGAGILSRCVRLPDVPRDVRRWTPVRLIAACQVFVPFLPVGTGGDFRQEIAIVISFIPVVAFLILWDAVLRGKTARIDKALVILFLASSVLAGLATGWLGGCVGNLVLAGIGYVRVRRRLPLVPVGALILVMLFLQGGKPAFRERFWYGDESAGAFTKAKFWIAKSAERLAALGAQPGGNSLHETLEMLLARSSVASESATVFENTPSLVGYQHGATYRYLLVTLIPRFMWPGKPSVNDANRFYQLAYGVTREQDLDHVAIGAGLIPEAYMNFGWIGIPVILCLAGMVLGLFERIFLWRDAGVFASATGLAYVLQLLALNGQAAAYFGGMIQIVGLTILIFLPGLRFRNASRRIAWRMRGAQEAAA